MHCNLATRALARVTASSSDSSSPVSHQRPSVHRGEPTSATEDPNFAGSNISGGSLASGQEACRTLGSNTQLMRAQRYWGSRSGESLGVGKVSLAEFTFNEPFYSWNSYDWFNLSHVDAHNLPLKIIPYELGSGTTCSTMTRSCPQNLLTNCPTQGQVRNAAGKVISCVSPNRDDPNNPVARFFDTSCAQAYSWSGDNSSMASCNAEDFDIVFCPLN